jgi:carbamoyltransferase
MPVVVGFSWPPEHDNAAAAIVDGKLVFAAEEERFTRHKHSHGEPPYHSLISMFNFLKTNYNIVPTDVKYYAVNFQPALMTKADRRVRLLSLARILDAQKLEYIGMRELGSMLIRTSTGVSDYVELSKRFLKVVLKRGFNLTLPRDIKVVAVEHHLAHAASSYYFSCFNSAAILCADGTGETESTVIWKAKNGEFEKVCAIRSDKGSLGQLYEAVTRPSGLGGLEGPGKAMGLAPYGVVEEERYSKFLKLLKKQTDLPYEFDTKGKSVKVIASIEQFYDELAVPLMSGLNLAWNPHGEINKDVANVSACIQKFVEDTIVTTARWTKDQTREQNLCLAGGVALNAKANMLVHYAKIFQDNFFFPAANDTGTTIGAAAWVYEHVMGEKMRNERLRTVYLGPEYSRAEIEKTVRRSKWKSEEIGQDMGPLVDLVKKGDMIGFYQGRAELGPRALGNRSFVGDPRSPKMWKKVNEIKGREWWRPLAPSILEEDASKYFVDPVFHPFMILMFEFMASARQRVPAVSHVDGTARPQTVSRQDNALWYDFIKAFKGDTGESILVNTSYNLAGEPLVETPLDALRSFAISGLDALYIDGHLIQKNSS